MTHRCANRFCSVPSPSNEGTLFRVDIELGDMAGRHKQKSAYVWLCVACAEKMKPRVEIVDGAVRVLLASRGTALRMAN